MEKPVLPGSGNIGILNRGEAALRFVRAVSEFNTLHQTTLKTVAFYLPEEEEAPFVQQADMAFSFLRLKGNRKIDRNVYLNMDQLKEAMDAMNCIAAWVGWGFLSEEASFIRFLEENGIIFLGPSSASVALLGDKIAAKELAENNNVPVTPWSKGPIKSLEEAEAFAEAIGYPCMIKAALTGGGRGIRRVNTREELKAKYTSASEETIRVTGQAVLFIEQVVERGRHLEVQTLTDRYGNVQTFGVRDCSVQRRNQKIIEETPPPNLDLAVIQEMESCSTRLLKAALYESAGTVEFLYDLDNNKFYFMEVNTRLQVEHPITEQAFGIDLVHGQIEVAMGKHLSPDKKISHTAAVEVRLNAEDPDRNFSPAPGKVIHFLIPAGPGLRIDSGINQGSTIPAEFDSMIAKIIAYAPTREMALARLHRALSELQIKIEGGTTNHAFLNALLSTPEIRQGGVHTRFVEELLDKKHEIINKKDWNIALIAAAIEQYLDHYREELINFKQQLTGTGYPRLLSVSGGMEIHMKAAGQSQGILVRGTGPAQYLVRTGDLVIALEYHLKKHGAILKAGNYYYHIQTIARGSDLQIEVDGIPYLIELESGGTVKAPSPAIVVSIAVEPGQTVNKGQILVILEAMKMEMIVQAPETGSVKEIVIHPGEQVAAGQPLLILDTAGENGQDTHDRIQESVSIEYTHLLNEENEWNIIEQEFRSVFLGYDHDPSVHKILERALAFPIRENQERKLVSLFLSGMKAFIDTERLFFSPPVESEKLSRLTSYRELLSHYFRRQVEREKGLPESFLNHLQAALQWYLPGETVEGSRDQAVHRLYVSHSNLENKQELLQKALLALERLSIPEHLLKGLSDQLDELAFMSQVERPALSDTAIHTRYQLIDRGIIQNWKEERRENTGKILERLVRYDRESRIYSKLIEFIMENKYHLLFDLAQKAKQGSDNERHLVMEILSRHMCNDRQFLNGTTMLISPQHSLRPDRNIQGGAQHSLSTNSSFKQGGDFHFFFLRTLKNKQTFSTFLTIAGADEIDKFLNTWIEYQSREQPEEMKDPELILLVNYSSGVDVDSLFKAVAARPISVLWISLGLLYPDGRTLFRTFHYTKNGDWAEDIIKRGFDPRAFREFRIYRLANFDLTTLYSSEFVHLLLLKARGNPRDERLYAMVEVPSSNAELDDAGNILRMVALENVFMEAVYIMRAEQAKRKRRLQWNRIIIHIDSMLNVTLKQHNEYSARIITRAFDLGIERIVLYSRQAGPDRENARDVEIFFALTSGSSLTLHIQKPDDSILEPTDSYAAKVVLARNQNTLYPYEIIKMVTRSNYQVKEIFPKGEFEEYDISLDTDNGTWKAVSVKGRTPGENPSNVVFGLITNYPDFYPRGIKRVILLSDSTKNMGALAEAECRRIIAALDLAAEKNLPLEWLPLSAGARIDLESGTENLDWTARVLQRIVQFTQAGGEINIIVLGINIGAQSYWNAEATMLMHTRGLLIMSENAAMLLTGKKALDFSGSISAENNIAIGGIEQIMGPNGEAQVRVKNVYEAYMTLFRHYRFTYCESGRSLPEPLPSQDMPDRDICKTPYRDILKQGFTSIGDIFSASLNPERKKPFDMRQLMNAVVDTDCPVFERWMEMKDAEIAIVWESRIGGFAAGLIGIQSYPLTRIGGIPHDGPEVWTGGTLFPLSSKKIARGINAFSGRLPLVILANLSGFDGSPESLRNLQLEYGAEIGRAIVNFKGGIFFIVTARYHGGAYVVFSKALNPGIRAIAFEGAFASVIGGAPAAAVVFPRLVLKETYADPRVVEAQQQLTMGQLTGQKDFDEIFQQVHSEKQAEFARRFDNIHSVGRARKVGSIDDIITPSELRPYLVQQLEELYRSAMGGEKADSGNFTYG